MICIGQLLLSTRSALDYGWYIQCHSIEETDSLFPRIYPLEITFWLEAGFHACFPFSVLGFCSAWVWACPLHDVRYWKCILRRLLKIKEKEMEAGILMGIIIHVTWEENFKKIKWTKTSCMTLNMLLKARHKGNAVNSTFTMVKENSRRQKFTYCENILQNWVSNKAMFFWKTKLSHHKNC